MFGWLPAALLALFWLVAWFNLRALRKRLNVPLRTTEIEHEATLGADGLALHDRFVPRSDIAKIEATDDLCVVTTSANERIELRGTPLELARAARYSTAPSDLPRDEAGEVLLTRVDIGQMRSESDGYRGIALDDARCLAIAEDPRAETRARIAAAELVRDRLDEPSRLRVEAAAEETAHAEVRQALLASARRA